MSLHVMWEGGVNCPPVTGDVQEDEKEKEEGKENQKRAPLPFIEIENMMKRVPPGRNDLVHKSSICPTLERDVSLFLNRLFASFDDSHAGDGIVQTGKGRAPVANDFLKKILPHGTNGVGIRGVSLGVNHGRSVFDPVPVAVAGGSFGADHFDHKGPRVSRMVVGCETGAQVGLSLIHI